MKIVEGIYTEKPLQCRGFAIYCYRYGYRENVQELTVMVPHTKALPVYDSSTTRRVERAFSAHMPS